LPKPRPQGLTATPRSCCVRGAWLAHTTAPSSDENEAHPWLTRRCSVLPWQVQYLLQRLTPAAIAHHGGSGGPCAQMAQSHFASGCPPGKLAPRLLRCATVADVFEAVSSNKAFHGVVLLEQGDSGILSAVRCALLFSASPSPHLRPRSRPYNVRRSTRAFLTPTIPAPTIPAPTIPAPTNPAPTIPAPTIPAR
jgi:hypothetical protein